MRTEVDAEGINEVRVECAATRFKLSFGEGAAVLEADAEPHGKWTLVREGDALVARAPVPRTGLDELAEVALTLPGSLDDGSVLLELRAIASEVEVAGSFVAIEAKIEASEADFQTQCEEARIKVAAGAVRAKLLGTAVAEIKVKAGELLAWFQEGAPSSLSVEVGVGSAEILLPDVTYQLSKSVALGKFRSNLQEKAGSPNQIEAKLGLGDLTFTRTAQPAPKLGLL